MGAGERQVIQRTSRLDDDVAAVRLQRVDHLSSRSKREGLISPRGCARGGN